MPKELQLQILGEFRGLPQQVMQTELDQFGKLERAGRTLHRFRVGDSQPPVDLETYGASGNDPYNPAMHQAGAIGRFYNLGASYTF